MDSFDIDIKKIEKVLSEQQQEREEILKKSREIILLCSRAVTDLHSNRPKEARAYLDKAKNKLSKIMPKEESLLRYLIQSEQEIVEAEILYHLTLEKRIPTIEQLGCSEESYLLGLLDSVGEIKRLAMNSIISGEDELSLFCFQIMEKIYSLTYPLSVYDNALPGIRRKIDIARSLVESVRGIIAEETSRKRLTTSLKRITKKIETF